MSRVTIPIRSPSEAMRPSNSQTVELELQKMKVSSFQLCCSVYTCTCTCAGCTVVCVCVCVHVPGALWSVCCVYMCRVHCGLCVCVYMCRVHCGLCAVCTCAGCTVVCVCVCTCAGCTVVCVLCVHVPGALWSVCVCVYMCRVHCGLCAVQETVEAYKKQNQFLSSELLEMNNLRSDDLSINKQQQRSVHMNLASLCCNVLLTSVVKQCVYMYIVHVHCTVACIYIYMYVFNER